jgi:molybdopterin synthase sulfur carrier subunit
VARLRFFAQAREAAGTGSAELDGATVGEVLDEARRRYGAHMAQVLAHSAVWLNGSPATADDQVGAGDEVAVLPPVSGGA